MSVMVGKLAETYRITLVAVLHGGCGTGTRWCQFDLLLSLFMCNCGWQLVNSELERYLTVEIRAD